MADMKKVLFICLGNICRSPIAEGVFLHLIKERGVEDQWEVDSAAIGSWHVGKTPDKRAQATLKKHNVAYNNRCRQICSADFLKYDYIFGMDDENISDINSRGKNEKKSKSEVLLLGDFDPENDRIIRDPYYDNDSEGFEKCYQQCLRCCNAFLDKHQ